MTEQRAYQDAEQAASDGMAGLFEKVADRIGLHAGARAAFGEPIERDGITVIPVAQVIFGTGAGGGESEDAGTGAGAGGGAITRPLGYVELHSGGAEFVPIRQPWQSASMIVSIAFAVLLLAKAVSTLVRGSG